MNAINVLKIKPLDLPGAADPVEIPEAGMSIGRDPSNDVVLPADRFPYVSSVHARVAREGDTYHVEDLKSKNGTLLNGQPVERSPIKAGDVIQLGREVGVRFLVVTGDPLSQTIDTSHLRSRAAPASTLSGTGVFKLKKALGLPDDLESLREAPRLAGRRMLIVLVLVLVPFAALVAYGFHYLSRSQSESIEELKSFHAALAAIRQRQTETDARFKQREVDWEAAKGKLEATRRGLLEQIMKLEKTDRASAGELGQLRRALASTNEKLGKFRPVDLALEERSKQDRYKRVLAATVYIEKKIAFRAKGTDKFLHKTGTGSPRLREMTDEDDVHYTGMMSGSGFCVSEKGWIVTNAHVVEVPEIEKPIKIGDSEIVMEPILDVVFSGRARRHSARVLRSLDEGEEDYAVIKIEPFAGMPVIGDFNLDIPTPDPGAETRLFGFPLGKHLRQEADTVIASLFRGTISRKVKPYIQVQAVVYPGISGGPMVDARGRVIGVVTGVQTFGSRSQIASDLGFALPVSGLKKIWPPE